MRSLLEVAEALEELAGGPFTDDEVRNIIASLERDAATRPPPVDGPGYREVGGAAQAAGPPWPLFVQDTLDVLAERVTAINLTVDLLAREEAVAERDLLDSIRSFGQGLDAGRKQLLADATRDIRG